MAKTPSRRAWERFFLKVEDQDNHCLVEDGEGVRLRVRVKDISLRGARIELLGGPDEGSDAEMVLRPDGTVLFTRCDLEKWGKHMCGAGARVVWVEGDQAGCFFHKPIGMGRV